MTNGNGNGHRINWTTSYINPDWIERARIYTVSHEDGRLVVGRQNQREDGRRYDGVVFPYYWPGEEFKRNERLRRNSPDYEKQPDGSNKEKNKYLGAPGWRNQVYFPPETDPEWLQDAIVPAVVVEGEKKAIALRRYFYERDERALIVCLPGVWNWRGTVESIRDSNGHKIADIKGTIADLFRIAWRGRQVKILFDANAATNESVNAARRLLAKELIRMGAMVRLLDLPAEEGVNGVDDFLGKHGPEALAKFFEEAEDGKNLQGISAFPFTDIGNAERLITRHGQNLKWHEAGKVWYIWDGQRWARDETLKVEFWAKETVRLIPIIEGAVTEDGEDVQAYARKCESNDKIKSMLARARAEQGIPTTVDKFDASPFLLNCANGTVNLKTGELQPHSREDLITKLVPIDYDPEAKCPRWEQFLREITDNDQELIDYFWQAIGYTLTGDITAQCVFVLHGMGANGKSVLLNTVRTLTGEYGEHTPIETFMVRNGNNMSNDLARLRGARIVTATETNEGQRLNESLIKQVTGGEPITARFLREEFFSFQPTFKLWFSVNHKPRISGTDYGLWRRVRLLPFEVRFPEGDPRRDEHLQDKLNAELPGILAWAVRGCHDWLERGFVLPSAVRLATEEYQRESDNIGEFIDECCVTGEEYSIRARDLYQAYVTWSEGQGARPKSSTAFGIALTGKGFAAGHGFSGKTRHGIALLQQSSDR